MSKTQEALKLALEALEYIDRQDNDRDFLSPEECCDLDDAITAIREALAEQPAQEQEVDWEKLYRLEVKKKEALAAKYERDTGKKLTRIVPMAEQPAQQEPVAWMGARDRTDLYYRKPPQADVVPLYTSPPASKPWVGLTDEEKERIRNNWGLRTYKAIEDTETKLREKNA